MKDLWKYKVIAVVALGWLLLTVVGYLGKDTIYARYEAESKNTPYFVVVLQGIHDGIYPWELGKETQDPGPQDGDILADQTPGTDTEILPDGTENPHGETEVSPDETETSSGETESSSDETEATEGAEPGTEMPEREFTDVETDYFDDAVFIGDSRTVGLHDYGGLDKADFFATIGLNVYDMWKEKFCEVEGKKRTLEEALTAKNYGKIYFQIGINEMGRGTVDSFMKAYAAAVQKFRELQPEAVIYVQGIMHVAKAKSDADPIFNNRGLVERNDRIAELADSRTVFYIDMNEAVCDDEGNLKAELTFDNLHLYGSKYNIWVDFLKTKGIVK